MACAGIHREHGARVKGVGHSSFTAEEAGRLRTTDNEKINLMWLARYNPRVERVKPPQDNSNQQQLKSWIRRKYVEKMWYQEAGSGGQNGGTPQGQQARQTQQPQQPQPTMVQLPPREQQPPQNDPFAYLEGVIRGKITVKPTDLSALENNLLVVEILEAAKKSAKKGKTVFLK